MRVISEGTRSIVEPTRLGIYLGKLFVKKIEKLQGGPKNGTKFRAP